MPRPMKVYTTRRTKKTIHLLQAGGELSPQEYKRIKDKYYRMLFGIIRAKLSTALVPNMEIETLTEEVIDDVFTDIKNYKWSFKFRSFLKKNIENKVWAKIHEIEKKPAELDEEKVDFVSYRTALRQKLEELDEPKRTDLVLQLVKEFVLPELRQRNELYHNVLHLKAINQWDYKAIANELNITVVNARKSYQLVKKLFIQIFRQYLDQMPFIDKSLYDTRRLMKILPLLKK